MSTNTLTRTKYPTMRPTRNPWYQISRDRAFQFGANRIEKLHDVQCIVSFYDAPEARRSTPCGCGGEAWLRDTVSGTFPVCVRCRAFPTMARSLQKIETEAGLIVQSCESNGGTKVPSGAELDRLEELRVEWKNSKMHGEYVRP